MPPSCGESGRASRERLNELVATGRIAYLDALRESVPPTLRDLLAIPGVGPRTIGEAWRELGIATLGGLRSGRSDRPPAGGARPRRAQRGTHPGGHRRGGSWAGPADADLARHGRSRDASWSSWRRCPACARRRSAGRVRRGCETVGDLDVLVETEQPDAVLAALAATPALEPGPVDDQPVGHVRLSLRAA